MIDQILALVKQYGQQSVVDNQDIPNEQNSAVMSEAASTITGGLQNILSGGGLQGLLGMFSGGGSNQNSIAGNPVVSMMVGHLAKNLMGKMNLSPAVANTVANNIIPGVINSLVSKTQSNAPEDNGFNLNDLIGAFTGGGNAAPQQAQTNGFDLQSLIGAFTGGGNQQQAESNGGGGLQDLIGSIAQQTQQQQAQGGGGLQDLIKGFFK